MLRTERIGQQGRPMHYSPRYHTGTQCRTETSGSPSSEVQNRRNNRTRRHL